MPSPEKPGAKPTEPDPMDAEEQREDEPILEEVVLPAPRPAAEKRESSPEEEEPRKIAVMLPMHPPKGAESEEACKLSGRSSSSKSSGSGASSGSRTSRDVGYASASSSQKSIPRYTITKSTESDSGMESPSRNRKSPTPEKGGRSPRQLAGEASPSSLELDKTKLGSKSQTGLRSPKSPKSKSPSPIKELVDQIGRVGKLVRDHSPLKFGKKLFGSKGRRGSQDEDQPLVGDGTSEQSKESESSESKKKSEGKSKSPGKKSPERITTECPLLQSDAESDQTVSTDLSLSSSLTSELKDKGLRKMPETAVGENMDTDDEGGVLENEPESPRTTPPLPEKGAEEPSGESSTSQQEEEAAGQIPVEKPKPEKPERRPSKDGDKDQDPKDPKDPPSKRSKTE